MRSRRPGRPRRDRSAARSSAFASSRNDTPLPFAAVSSVDPATRSVRMLKRAKVIVVAAAIAACSDDASFAQSPFTTTPMAEFNEPWAMAFLPDGRLFVTEKRGALKLYSFHSRQSADVSGVPPVEYGGQGGLGDVLLHPSFGANNLVYLSYAEPGERGQAGAAVARARLALNAAGGGALEDLRVIWRQTPKVDGRGHYGHRIAFGPDGFLYI